jgi:hypothetical protein
MAVLETLHSICVPLRARVRMDALFTVTNAVLVRCVTQMLAPLCTMARLLPAPSRDAQGYAARAVAALVASCYNLSCEDLP